MSNKKIKNSRPTVWSVVTLTLVLSQLLFSSSANAQFRARYFEECYEPLAQARELVPKPPRDIGKTVNAVGRVAGIAGSFGGLGGLGSLGGNAAKAAETVNTLNKYSGLIQDVAGFTSAMQTEFPSLGARFGAYGSRLGEDADLLVEAGEQLAIAQDCYGEAYDTLSTAYATEEMKRRDVNRRHREIEKGIEFADEILVHAKQRVNKNIESYNEALQNETQGAGINLGSLLGAVTSTGVAGQIGNAVGVDALSGCDAAPWYSAKAQGCARALPGGAGLCMPTQDCSINAVRARAASSGGATANYGVMQELSVLGAMGAGPSGAAGAVALLGGALAGNGSSNSGTVSGTASAQVSVDDEVLQGLVEAGAMSSRYIMVNQGIETASSQLQELRDRTKDSPAKR